MSESSSLSTIPGLDPSSLARMLRGAVLLGSVEKAREALAMGADPNAPPYGSLDAIALTTAAMDGHVDVARVLLEAGAQVDGVDKNGWTALRYAAQRHGPLSGELAALLLAHGADPHKQGEGAGFARMSPVDEAMRRGRKDFLRALFESGYDFDKPRGEAEESSWQGDSARERFPWIAPVLQNWLARREADEIADAVAPRVPEAEPSARSKPPRRI